MEIIHEKQTILPFNMPKTWENRGSPYRLINWLQYDYNFFLHYKVAHENVFITLFKSILHMDR